MIKTATIIILIIVTFRECLPHVTHKVGIRITLHKPAE